MRSTDVIQGAGMGIRKEETRAHYAEKNDGLGWRMGIPVGMQIGYREINPSGNCQFIHCPSPPAPTRKMTDYSIPRNTKTKTDLIGA